MIFYSLLHNGKNRKEILIRSSFFIVILYVFSKLWQATQFPNSADPQFMIWYLSVTELIVLSIPFIQVDIENDIRSGDVVYQLLRPFSYLWLKISENVGTFFCRFSTLALIAIPYSAYLSGTIPPIPSLLAAYFTAALAGIVFILFQTAIGLLAFKLQDSTPIFWVWQRCSFLFGGLVIPLDFYPPYLKFASYFLPFSSLIYAPAKLIIDCSISKLLVAWVFIFSWGIIAYFLANLIYHRMLKSLKINGG